jgi:hypothetical protein
MTDARPNPRVSRIAMLAAAMLVAAWPWRVAHAVPSFARQTGLECVACHVSWPELTSVGRQFKLGAYTLQQAAPVKDEDRPLVSFDKDGPPPMVPLAAFVQASVTHTKRTNTPGTDSSTFPKQDEPVLQQASLLLAGRISEHAGGFVQWSYDGVEHHAAMDNVDLRVANRYESDSLKLQYGLSLNNSPTVSDIYNSTPVWGFPFASSSVAAAPAASTLIQEGLAQQVVGLSAYTLWNRTLYAELGGYRTADGAFTILREGQDRSTAAVLDGTAPYWRLALQREWGDGAHSAMLGTFGLIARKFPDPTQPQGPTDRFRDIGIDAQYQFVSDRRRFSAQLSYIRERQTLDGSLAAGAAANLHDTLSSLNAKLTYYHQLQYGLSLGYQRTRGDRDDTLYNTGEPVNGSASGRPDSAAWIVELNWLPWRDRRFTLQYTAWQKFNGARSNYDGFGRNARDNNTLLLMAWFVF